MRRVHCCATVFATSLGSAHPSCRLRWLKSAGGLLARLAQRRRPRPGSGRGPLRRARRAGWSARQEPDRRPGARARVALSVPSLVDDLWEDTPPRQERAALQTLVSRVRTASADGLLESTPTGYALAVPPEHTDLGLARALLERARRADAGGDPARPPKRRDCALGSVARGAGRRTRDLLHSRPNSDAPPPPCATSCCCVRARSHRMHGDPSAALADLDPLVAASPLDEAVQLERLRALDAAGRRNDALRAFGELKARLLDPLGTRPGPELVALNASLAGRRRVCGRPPVTAAPGANRSAHGPQRTDRPRVRPRRCRRPRRHLPPDHDPRRRRTRQDATRAGGREPRRAHPGGGRASSWRACARATTSLSPSRRPSASGRHGPPGPATTRARSIDLRSRILGVLERTRDSAHRRQLRAHRRRGRRVGRGHPRLDDDRARARHQSRTRSRSAPSTCIRSIRSERPVADRHRPVDAGVGRPVSLGPAVALFVERARAARPGRRAARSMPWHGSATGSTGCRSPSSSPPHASARCRSTRSSAASATGSRS